MIPHIRKAFNDTYNEEYYKNFQKEVIDTYGEAAGFRLCETPVFISKELKNNLLDACDAILKQLQGIDFQEVRERFIPKDMQCPVPMNPSELLAIDFGLCDDGNGGITPQLIELQAFATLYLYQPWLGKAYKNNYPNLPKEGFSPYLSGLNASTYLEEIKSLILGNENPENVILLELFPEKQKTRIDFWATRDALGIDVVCMTDVIKEGKQLYRVKDGKKIPIHRIYNRVIMDELVTIKDLEVDFKLSDDLDVKWVCHPDWFFLISKCIVPMLKHKNIPPSYYLDNYPEDINLENFVLKPLFSFAGKGVNLYPNQEAIDAIKDKHNYILQKKVNYVPVIKTTAEKNSKAEIRMMFIWDKEEQKFKPVINITRVSKGELINVSYATGETWIGSSISFFEE